MEKKLKINELNERILKIKSYEENIKNSYWNIGRELKEIKDKELYKEQGFKNITEFSEVNFNYKKSMTYNLLKIAELEYSNVLENKSVRELLALASPAEETEEMKQTKEQIAKAIEEGEKQVLDAVLECYERLLKIKDVYYEMAGIQDTRHKAMDLYNTLMTGKGVQHETRYTAEIEKIIPSWAVGPLKAYHVYLESD